MTQQDTATITRTGSAWIEPTGTVHPVEECGHYRWAVDNGYNDTRDLESRDWVHLSFGAVYFYGRKLSQSQVDTLFDVWMALDAAQSHYAAIIQSDLSEQM